MLGNSSWFIEDWNTRADRPAGVDLSKIDRWSTSDVMYHHERDADWVRYSDLQALQPKGVTRQDLMEIIAGKSISDASANAAVDQIMALLQERMGKGAVL
jgi:hypothetical protein